MEKIKINPDWKVLDIGSRHNLFRRANVLLEKELEESIHRSGERAKSFEHQTLVLGDATNMPFEDNEFDYAIASHVAEHIEDIDKFMRELQRVSKRGYIETPGPLSEMMFNEPYHLWIVYKKGDTLIFKKKKKFRPLSKVFYALFYLNEYRYGHKTFYSKNSFVKLPKLILNKTWKHLPLTYTKYNWEGRIKYLIYK